MRVRPLRPARNSRPQQFIAALVPVLIVTLSITGFVWAQKRVTVVVDGKTANAQTQAADVAELLSQSGVSVDDGDVVTPAPATPLTDGMKVVVRHSVPVILQLGGKRVEVDVVGERVADALVAAGVDPAANTAVNPPLDTPLTAGMTVTAPEIFVRVVTEEATVAAPVEYREDPSLPKGAEQVVTEGVPGEVLRVYRIVVSEGVEGTPVLTLERVTTPAVARVVARGTGEGLFASARKSTASRIRVGKAPAGGRRLRVEATGYAPGCDGVDNITATGARAGYGIIAVDPRVIPMGTKLYIPGYGYGVAADTGGAIKGNRIDLCFDTRADAIQWGRRSVTIIILK